MPEEGEQALERVALDVPQPRRDQHVLLGEYAEPVERALGRGGLASGTAVAQACKGGPAVRPRARLLELRGDAQQQVLAAVGGDELHADGQPVGRPVQRQRDRRLAGHVEGQR